MEDKAMDKRNRGNDNGTAAVLVALLAGISAIGVLGGALFFLSEDSGDKTETTAALASQESQCAEEDVACGR
jgi:hypothetical protein